MQPEHCVERDSYQQVLNLRPRHGSTVYLWKERDVAKAIEYVMLGQGEDLFRL